LPGKGDKVKMETEKKETAKTENLEVKEQVMQICYKAKRPINIGDVFYKIEKGRFFDFREPCKVCNGTHKLTVNGVTFDCPCCGKTNEAISITSYNVHHYRVFSINEETNNDCWKLSDSRYIKFGFYRKIGRGYGFMGNTLTIECSAASFNEYFNMELPEIFKKDFYESIYTDCAIYDDYSLAVKVADTLTKRELDKLAKYNAEHNTNYFVKFTDCHDKKSI